MSTLVEAYENYINDLQKDIDIQNKEIEIIKNRLKEKKAIQKELKKQLRIIKWELWIHFFKCY